MRSSRKCDKGWDVVPVIGVFVVLESFWEISLGAVGHGRLF